MALVLFGTAAASAQDLGTPVPLEEAEREWLTLHDTIRIAPPLVISDEDLDWAMQKFETVLKG